MKLTITVHWTAATKCNDAAPVPHYKHIQDTYKAFRHANKSHSIFRLLMTETYHYNKRSKPLQYIVTSVTIQQCNDATPVPQYNKIKPPDTPISPIQFFGFWRLKYTITINERNQLKYSVPSVTMQHQSPQKKKFLPHVNKSHSVFRLLSAPHRVYPNPHHHVPCRLYPVP